MALSTREPERSRLEVLFSSACMLFHTTLLLYYANAFLNLLLLYYYSILAN